MEYSSIEQEGEKRNQILCEDLNRMSTAHCRREGRKTTLLLASDALRARLGLISYKHKGNKSTWLTRTVPRPLQATAVDQGAFQWSRNPSAGVWSWDCRFDDNAMYCSSITFKSSIYFIHYLIHLLPWETSKNIANYEF